MKEAYIVRRGTTQPVGVTQITDLKPNTSRRSLTYDKVPQSGYLGPRPDNSTLSVDGSNLTTAAFTGLGAYFADVLARAGGGNGVSPAEANDMAAAVIAVSDAGTTLGEAEINTAIQTVVGATVLSGGSSVGTVADVLKILSGGTYYLPAGKLVNSGAGKAAVTGAFSTSVGYRQLYQTGALTLSVSEGDLATLISQNKAVVYADDGAVLS